MTRPNKVTNLSILNGHQLKQIYCPTWWVVRPPRCCHCYYCNNCVERFDHHWPWISWCIGKRNYTYFIIFINWLSMYLVTILTAALYVLARHSDTFAKKIRENLTAIFLIIYVVWIGAFVVSLTLYHHVIMLRGETTFENLKRIYRYTSNPFKETLFQNYLMQFLPFRGKLFFKVILWFRPW